MNKEGSISVEALISVSIFLLLAGFLVGLIQFVGINDYVSQEVFNEVHKLELFNYAYEKIGVLEGADLIRVKKEWPSDLMYVLEADMYARGSEKEGVLRALFKQGLAGLEKNRQVTDVAIEAFGLEGEVLETKVTYDQDIALGFKVHQAIHVKAQLWYLGSEPWLIEDLSLADVLKKKSLRPTKRYT